MAVVMAFLSMPGTLGAPSVIFSGMLVNDLFSVAMRGLVLMAVGLTVLMSIGYNWPDHDDAGEYYFFLQLLPQMPVIYCEQQARNRVKGLYHRQHPLQ